MQKLLFLSYIVGYSQLIPSRTFRRIIAKSEVHRAWLAGNQGNIGEEDGVLYRRWFTNRKEHKNASVSQVRHCLRSFYGLTIYDTHRFLLVEIFKDMIESCWQNYKNSRT